MSLPSAALLVDEVQQERRRLVALLERLTPDQWETPSLCGGWRVREVVAHVLQPFTTPTWKVALGVAGAGFSFDRYADRAARAVAAELGPDDLVALLRQHVTHPWAPPGGGVIGALSHDVIHGLDVTVPLGLPPAPPERLALVLRHAGARQIAYFGVDLSGVRLSAADADVTVGDGPRVVVLPASEALLTVTGRKPVPPATPGA